MLPPKNKMIEDTILPCSMDLLAPPVTFAFKKNSHMSPLED